MDLDRGLPRETPLDNVSGLKLKYVRTRGQLFEAEYRNVAKAVTKYLARKPSRRTAPFTREWTLRLHREMFGDVWLWAGQIRRSEKRPGIPPRAIEIEMAKLLGDADYWKDHDGDAVEEAAILHHRAVWIHPFENGNGRWARLLAQIWQYQKAGTYTLWPETDLWHGTSSVRDEYIDALREADNGDIDPLIKLHRRFTVS
ncbi:MAG: mobile mystery protein B [Planctomycetota bacterium]|jgi:Fic-DOC domain mobile mystery protein B